jgi:hypothetical protein
VEDKVSMEEIEAESAISLPSKEVLSLLDVNANVDLGLDLAAPVDLAAAANLDVAAPIEAAASANVLSPDAQAIGVAQQNGTIDQGISGSATATAPQHAEVTQNSTAGAATAAPATVDGASTDGGTPTVDGTAGDTGGAVDGVTGAVGSAVDGATGAVGSTAGGVESLLNGGSLLDANIDIHANANLAAPIDGAVAANANVAAPVDAAVGANIGSAGATAEALAPQDVAISQHLDGVSATATADQNATVTQQ